VGRHLQELITGTEPSLDLAVFGTRRILEKKPIVTNVIV
jgi:hypothetical protein